MKIILSVVSFVCFSALSVYLNNGYCFAYSVISFISIIIFSILELYYKWKSDTNTNIENLKNAIYLYKKDYEELKETVSRIITKLNMSGK